jgi:hypothetical protein
MGCALGSGFALIFWPKAEPEGPSPKPLSTLTAGRSPASHPAAKPEWMESSFRRLLLFKSVLTSGGKAGVDGVKFQVTPALQIGTHIRRQAGMDGVKFPLLNYKLTFTAN